MNLRERFQKLSNLEQTLREKEKKTDKEKIAELRKRYKIYVPLIDRVCREFAKGVGWRYAGPDTKSERKITKTYYDIIRFPIGGNNPSCEFTVILQLGSGDIFLKGEGLWGTGDSPSGWRDKSEFVCYLNDFAEEKLVTALEALFKDLLKYLYGT